MSRKICVVITARPSYSRIKSALHAIQEHPDLELQLVVAASALLDRYGNTIQIIEADAFKVAASVYMVLAGENLLTSAKSTGIGLSEMATVIHGLQPDIVVTIADRYETIATAIAASYLNLPLAHVQGGEVTGSVDDRVRHAITKLSDYHLVSSQRARERVIRMGEDPEMVFLTGCPSIDLAVAIQDSRALDFDPLTKYGGVGAPLDLSDGYIVVMQHPVTTEYAESRRHVTETLYSVRDMGIPALWFWPNADAGADGTSEGIRAFRELEEVPNIHFFKNMIPEDFLKLIYHSRCLVGNSSTGVRESSFLGIPVVNVGTRQQGRERGPNVIDVGYDRAEISSALERQLAHGPYSSSGIYGDGHAGERIANVLAQVPLKNTKNLTY
jgi:UDP-hydrolysing UDP-N-acetyl-D-glucosamine 2-epimerase